LSIWRGREKVTKNKNNKKKNIKRKNKNVYINHLRNSKKILILKVGKKEKCYFC
jgi:hypothetical protein